MNDVLSRYELKEAIRALANRKTVGSDGLPAELGLGRRRRLDTLGMFHDIIVAV